MKATRVALLLLGLCLVALGQLTVTAEPGFERKMARLLDPNTPVQVVGNLTVFGFTEGPLYLPTEDSFIFAARGINGHIGGIQYQLQDDGTLFQRRPTCNGCNGNALDEDGNLLTNEQTRIQKYNLATGENETLVDNFEGESFVSLNDITVKSDGSIWFTDRPGNWVYRYQEKNRGRNKPPKITLTRVAPEVANVTLPNGLAFSRDENTFHYASNIDPSVIVSCKVRRRDDSLVRCSDTVMPNNVFADGMEVDQYGNLWVASADGVYVFDSRMDVMGLLSFSPPLRMTNLAWGGPDYKTLLVTGGTVYKFDTKVRWSGAPRCRGRRCRRDAEAWKMFDEDEESGAQALGFLPALALLLIAIF